MTELVKSVSIENMANQRAAVAGLLAQAHSILMQAKELAQRAHLGELGNIFEPHRYGGNVNFTDVDGVAKAMKHLDSKGWKYLMSESGMRSLMDSTARDKWDKAIAEGEYPELTRNNIEATFGQLYEARTDMFERGILEVFRRLSWDYKTNEPFKFGKRIILDWVLNTSGHGEKRSFYVNSKKADELDDLVRVFSILDGKPEPDHRHGMYSNIARAMQLREWNLETEYFALVWFKKGTGHLTFKRPDLVNKMNLVIAKHHPAALPAKQ